MKFTWIGQAGLILDNGKKKIMIDPYLSHSVEKVEPQNVRRIPIKQELLEIEPDVMIFTHDHLDHYDPETVPAFLGEGRKPKTVLCPYSVWQKARRFGGPHNYILFDRHTEWTEYGFRFRAVGAAHSDRFAIGVIIEALDEGKVCYVTGDTLYSREILRDLPEGIDVVFLPINGVGNNMNAADAVRFFKDCGARVAVPYHVGMFDGLSPAVIEAAERIVPRLYEEIEV